MLELLLGSPGELSRRTNEWGAAHGGFRVGRVKTVAGPVVDEDIALTYAACWRATSLLAETIAGLPLQLYERTGPDRKLATDLPLYDMVHDRPNDEMGSMAFREGRLVDQINAGNGFAEIERNSFGEPVALHTVHASRVYPARPEQKAAGFAYNFRLNSGKSIPMRADEVLHVPGKMPSAGIWGKSVITHARESIGFGLATERHGAAYFGSGGQPKGILTIPGVEDREQRALFRAELHEVHDGPENREPLILPPEASFQPITISMEDSQFLQTRKHNDIVIAQWYGVPVHMLGNLDNAKFSNIEHKQLEFIMFSLMPWALRWEEQMKLKLLTREQGRTLFFEHNFNGLLRADGKARFEMYRIAINNALMTPNQVRRIENHNPIGPEGDQYFIGKNMTTIDKVFREPNPARVSATQIAVPDMREAADDGAGQLRPILVDILGRMFRKEANAARRPLAANSCDFEAWLSDFHGKHRQTIADALVSVAEAFPSILNMDRGTIPSQVAHLCVEASAKVLTEAYNTDTPEEMAARLDAWGETMAAVITDQILGDKDHAD